MTRPDRRRRTRGPGLAGRGRRCAGWDAASLHLWRSSLSFRVVVVTMLLGVLVLTAVGTYLYGSIAQGLVDSRQRIAEDDSFRDATDAQAPVQLHRPDRQPGQADAVRHRPDQVATAAAPATSRATSCSRRFEDNTSPGPRRAARERQRRRALHPRGAARRRSRPSLTGSTCRWPPIEEDGDPISAVIVGQRIDAGVAGDYGLYFIYPMHRERETISVIGQTFLLGGAALILLARAPSPSS